MSPLRRFRKKSKPKKNTTKSRAPLDHNKAGRLMLALEPRYLFDAAAVATGLDLLADHDASPVDIPDEIASLSPIHPGDLPAVPVDFNNLDSATELIFIDPTVTNYQDLIAGISTNAQIVVLDGTKNGIEQITNVLADKHNLEALHIVSHGGDGQLNIGNSTLSSENIAQYSQLLTQWDSSLTTDADILLYGCNVAASDSGVDFVNTLAEITKADVAASDDLTGNAEKGGDWDLEINTGVIETDRAFLSTEKSYQDVLASPTLGAGGANMTAITENDTTAANNGDSVFTILNGQFADGDGDPEGIAIIDAQHENGNWQFSTDNGVTWTNVGTVSTTNALLLRGDGATPDRIRFLPDGKNAPSALPTFTYYAWDQSSGIEGIKVDTSGDPAFSATSNTANITVSAVNDAPVLDNTGTMTMTSFDEDTASGSIAGDTISSILASAGGDRITDVDSGALEGIAITATTGSGTWEYSVNGGANWFAVGAVANNSSRVLHSDALVRFVPNANVFGTPAATFTFKAWDQTGGYANGQATVDTGVGGTSTPFSTATEDVSLDVNAVNDAPDFTGGGADFTTITEDVTAGTGNAVSDLITNFTDPDAGSEGIAIHTIDNSNGTWQYSTNAGVSWSDIGTVSDTAALLLRDTDRVRFVPDAQNADTASIDFYAWDQTGVSAGLQGTKVDVQTRGTDTAFSSATDNAAITVTALNDAPGFSADGTLASSNEDVFTPPGDTVTNIIGANFSDVDTGATFSGIAVVGSTANGGTQGVWQFSDDAGASWLAIGTGMADDANSVAISAASMLRFVPVADYNGTPPSLTIRALDNTYAGPWSDSSVAVQTIDTSTPGGTTAIAGSTNSIGTTIDPVNDSPTLAAGATMTAIAEDASSSGQTITSLLNANFADIDGDSLGGVAITVNTANAGTEGAWQYSTNSGSNWFDIGTGVANNSALIVDKNTLIRFSPFTNYNGSPPVITVRAVDSSYAGAYSTTAGAETRVLVDTTGAGTAPSVYAGTARDIDITVNAANDAPTFGGAGADLASVNEDAASSTSLVGALINISDVDAGAVEGIAIYSISSGNGTWQYDIGGGWFDISPVSLTSALLLEDADSVRFIPDGNNATSASISFYAWDRTSGTAGNRVDVSTRGGTTAFSSAADTASITVTAVNDAPAAFTSNATLAAANEDAANPSGDTVSNLFSGFFSDVDTGASLGGIAVIGNTANGGTEGAWQYSTDSGTTWMAIGVVADDATAVALSAATLVRFLPVADYNGAPPDLTVRAIDDTYGGAWSDSTAAIQNTDSSVNGGTTAISGSTNTISTSITAVNDAPLLNAGATPVLTAIAEDDTTSTGDSIASIVVNGSITETPADETAVEAIAVTNVDNTNGIWQYSTDNGATWNNFTGTTGSAVDISATAVLLDGTLGGASTNKIRFVPGTDYSGTATFTFRAWDTSSGSAGGTADASSGGGTTAFSTNTDTASITVNSANDAPVLITTDNLTLPTILEEETAPSAPLVSEILASGASGNPITDSDVGAVEGIAVIGVDETLGTWEYRINAGAWTKFNLDTPTATNATLLYDNARIRFLPTTGGNFNGTATITFHAWDQTGGGLVDGQTGVDISAFGTGGSAPFSLLTDTAQITITNVNDAPVITATGPTMTAISEDDTNNAGELISSFIGATITDPDGVSELEGIAIYSINDNGNGTWEYYNGATWQAIDDGSLATNHALLLRSNDLIRFNPSTNNGGTADLTYYAWDQSAGTEYTYVNATTRDNDTPYSALNDTVTITINAANDAPILTPGAPTMNTITENEITNNGEFVSGIVGATITDVDTGALQGIAIHTLSSGNGTWQYSTNGGTTWTNVGTVSTSSALLLESGHKVRFLPNDQNSTSGNFQFYAWDRSSGVAGVKVDASTRGNATAFSSASDTASITVTAVNDAPVLDNSVAMTLTAVLEDEANPAGDTVSAIIASAGGDRITDVDSGAVEGIAVTTVDNTNGTWEYSTNGGTTWNAFGAVVETSARLLNASAMVRFVPNGDYNDITGPSMTFRAWDTTSGSNGGTANASTNGTTTAFSSNTHTASAAVTAVNDAPVLDNSGIMSLSTITEDVSSPAGSTIATIISSAGGNRITDTDTGDPEGIAIHTVTSSNGTWEFSTNGGVSWSAIGPVADNSALLLGSTDMLRFVPDGQNADSASIDFYAWDQSSGSAGGKVNASSRGLTTAFSTASENVTITVTALNDAPVLTPTGGFSIGSMPEEDSGFAETVSNIINVHGGGLITDVDTGAVDGLAIIGVDNSNGTWRYHDGTWHNFTGTESASQAVLLSSTAFIGFIPNANFSGTASLTIRAWDTTSGANGQTGVDTSSNGGTTAFSSATDTLSVTVTNVNDAPVLAPAAPTLTTITEDDTGNSGSLVSAIVGLSITDPDGVSEPEGIAIYNLNSGNGTWQYDTGSGWTNVGAVDTGGVNGALLLRSTDSIRFLPDGNNNTTADFSYYAWDQSSGSAGSKVSVLSTGGTTAFSSANDTASITVTAVNDAPVLTPGGPSLTAVSEDSSNPGGDLVSALVLASIADVDSSAVEGIAIYASTGSNGTWEYNAGSGWTTLGVVDSNNALLLRSTDSVRFVPDGTKSPAANPTISYYAWDRSSGTAGTKVSVASRGTTTAFSITGDVADITITDVNDAPTLSDQNYAFTTILEDQPYNNDATDGNTVTELIDSVNGGLNISDVDLATPANAPKSIAVTQVDNTNGFWQYWDGGSWQNFNGGAGVQDISANARLLDTTDRIRFVPTANWSGSATIQFRAWDQTAGVALGTANASTGGTTTPFSSLADTATLTISPSNDAPVISDLDTDSVTFTEAGGPVSLDEIGVALSIADSIDNPTDFNGGNLTVAFQANSTADDRLTIANIGTGVGQIGISGSTVTYEGNTIGSFTGGDDGSTPLVITFSSANATPTAVTALAKAIRFNNATADPGSTARTIRFTVDDGDGGASTSAAADVTVNMNVINDIPVLANLNGDTVTFTENLGPVLLDLGSDVTITDADSAIFDGGNLTVAFGANTTVNDRLTVRNIGTGAGQIGYSGGNVTYAGTLIGTAVGGNDGVTSLVITLNASASQAAVTALIKAIEFENVSEGPDTTARTIQFTVNDGDGGTSLSNDVTVNITAVNDAPSFTGNATLGAVTEDTASPAGDNITNLFGGLFNDVDAASSMGGLAVVGNPANSGSQGAWQYSTDAGTTWMDIGVVADDATAVALSAATLVRFVPVADYDGAVPSLTVRALDNTYAGGWSDSTAALVNVDTSTNGGTTAIAAGTDTLDTSITAVNDDPSFSSDATLAAVNEDTASPAGDTLTNLFGAFFADPDTGSSFGGVAVMGNTANAGTEGAWQYSTDAGTTWMDIGVVADDGTAVALSAATLVRFVPVADYNGTPPSLTVRAIDDTYGGAWSDSTAALVNIDSSVNGAANPIAATTNTIDTSITAVNDAPSFTGNATLGAVTEDTASPAGDTITNLFGGLFNDVDAASSMGGLAVVGNPANAGSQGAWQYSTDAGTTWMDIGVVADDGTAVALSAATLVRFVPVADYDGAVPSLTVRALDNTYAGGWSDSTTALVNVDTSTNGGTTAIAAGTDTLDTSITAVNDDPSFSSDATLAAVNEDTANPAGDTLTNLFGAFFTDPDTGSSFGGVAVMGNTPNAGSEGAWQYSTDAGTTWMDIGVVADDGTAVALSAATLVRFVPVADYDITPPSLTVRAIDDTYGGAWSDSTAALVNIDSSVNGAANPIAATTNTIDTSITAINDDPSFSSDATLAAVNEDTASPAGDTLTNLFGAFFTDPDTGSSFGGVAVMGNTANAGTEGAWQYSTDAGTTWMDIGVVADDGTAVALSAATLVRFVPVADYNGTPPSLTVRAIDDTYGGAWSDSTAALVNIDSSVNGAANPIAATTNTIDTSITAVNDAPSFTGNATLGAVTEDTASPAGDTITNLFGGLFNDVDAASSMGGLAVVGNPANAGSQGAWQYSTDAGTTWMDIGAVADDGTAVALSAATLVRFVPVADYDGAVPSLTVRALDNTYAGGWSDSTAALVNVDTSTNGGTTAIAAGTDTLDTSITAVNDDPSFSSDATLAAVNEDTASPAGDTLTNLFGAFFTDPDTGSSFGGVAVMGNTANAGTEGAWQYSTDAGTTWMDIGVVADDATAVALSTATLVRFVPVADYNGTPPSLTVRAIDDTYGGAWSDSTAALVNIDSSVNGAANPIAATTNTIDTSITAVNDAPSFTGNATLAAVTEDTASPAGDTITNLFGGLFNDVDAASSMGGLAVVGNPAIAASQGAWQYSTDAGTTWMDIGVVADDATAVALSAATLVRFVPVADYDGAVPSLTVRALDNTYAGGWSDSTTALVNVDTSTNGGTTAIAAGTDTLDTSITAVNDDPSFSSDATLAAVNEDTANPAGDTLTNLFGAFFTDPDTGSSFGGVAVMGNTANAGSEGAWQYSTDAGTTWMDIGVVADDGTAVALSAATLVRFVPVADYDITPPSLTVRAIDDTYGGAWSDSTAALVNIDSSVNGAANPIAATTNTIDTSITAINDDPSFSSDATLAAVNEDTASPAGDTLTNLFGAFFTDPDTGSSFGGVAVMGNTANAGTEGAWQYSTDAGTTWMDIGVVADDGTAVALSAATLVRFVPVADYNGTPPSLTVRAIDDTYGGAWSDSTAALVNIDSSVNGAANPIAATTNTIDTSITAVNDAPSFTGNATLGAVTEDTASPAGDTITNLFGGLFNDVDAASSMGGLAVVGNPAIAASQGAWQYSTDAGTTWMDIGVVADDATAVALSAATLVCFVPVADYDGAVPSLTVRALDNTYAGGWSDSTAALVNVDTSTNGGTTAIAAGTDTLDTSITAVNDDPSFSSDATLAAVNEDTASPAGDTLTNLFGAFFTDPDTGSSFGGVAVMGNTANAGTEGAWQYSTDAGTTWMDIGVVADDATAVALSTATLVRFVPVADYNGTPPSLTVRAIDDTYGGAWSDSTAALVNIDSSVNGAANPIAATTNTIDTSITAVNDAPSFTGNATLAAVTEDTASPAGDTITNLFGGLFNDVDAASSMGGLAVVGNPANAGSQGAWQYSTDAGTTWMDIGVVADDATAVALSAATLVRFVPVADYDGAVPSLTVRALDNTYAGGWSDSTAALVNVDTSTNGGTTAIAAGTDILDTSITAVNDDPSFSSDATLAAVNEDTASPPGDTLTNLFGAFFTDPDTGSSFGGVAVMGNTANAGTEGAWQYSTDAGTTWMDLGVVADDGTAVALSAATLVRFVPVADYNGTPPSLTVRAIDDTYGGAWSDSTAALVNIDSSVNGAANPIAATTNTIDTSITAVNDAPTLTATGNDPTFTEDGAAATIFSAAAISAIEASQNIQQLVLTVTNVTDGADEILVIDGTNVALTDLNSGTTPTNSFGYSISLVGGTATVTISKSDTASSYQTMVNALAYTNSSDTPTTASTRVVTITSIQDSGGTTPGVDTTALAVASTVSLVANNDAPILSFPSANPTFAENGTAVPLDAAATIVDPELDGQNGGFGDYNNATISVVRNGGANADDTFSINSGGGITVSGTDIVGATNIIATFSTAGNQLLVTFTNANGESPTTAQVNQVMRAITYANSNDNPPASVIIDCTISDANAGAQGVGGVGTDTTSKIVNITSTNDAPTAVPLTFTENYTEGDLTVPITDIVVSDPDAGETIIATLTLANTATGVLTTSGTATYDGVTGIWTINDTLANVNTALANVSFTPATDNDVNTTIAVNIVDGQEDGPTAQTGTITLNVTPVQDIPDSADGTVNTVQNVPINFSSADFTFTDVDTLDVFSGIEIKSLPNGTEGTLTIGGSPVAINTLYSAAQVDTLVFTPALDFIGNGVTFGFRVWDGTDFCTATYTMSMDVISANAPTIVVNSSSTFNFIEGDTPTTIADFSIFDVYDVKDAIIAGTLQLNGANWDIGQEFLTWDTSLAAAYNIQGSFNATSGLLNFTRYNPLVDYATTAQFAAVLDTVKYEHTSQTPTNGDRYIDIQVQDNDTSPQVQNWSSTTTITATVTAVNSAPVLSGVDNTLSISEQDPAAALDDSITVSDIELDALAGGSGNYAGASLTLTRNGGADADDVFSSKPAGTLGALTVGAGNLTVSGLSIGDVTTNSAGTLVLTFNANATTARVNAVLSQIWYQNTSNIPEPSVQIDYIFNDGNTVSQGFGNLLTDTGSVTVNITEINDPPAITLSAYAPAFTEGGVPDFIDSGATIADLDLDEANDYNGSTLTIQRNGGANTDDIFSESGVLSALTESGTFNVGAGAIGTVTQNSNGTLVLTFNSSATSAAVDQVIQAIQYANNSDDPAGTVNLDLTFNDGTTTDTQTKAITITPVNDAPTFSTTAANSTFTEGGPAATLFNSTAISTVEAGQTIDQLVFSIDNVTDGANELLSIDGQNVTLATGAGTTTANSFGYNIVLAGNLATVTITKSDTVTNYQTLVDGLGYSNSSSLATTTNRIATLVSITDSGGTANGGVDTAVLSTVSTIAVQRINDAPVLSNLDASVAYTENGAAFALDNGDVAVSDAELDLLNSGNGDYSGATITVNRQGGANTDDIYTITTGGGLTSTAGNSLQAAGGEFGTYTSANGVLTITFNSSATAATTALVNDVLQNINYQNSSDAFAIGSLTATNHTFTFNDGNTGSQGAGGAFSDSKSITVNITGLNDAPTLNQNNGATVTEAGTVIIDNTMLRYDDLDTLPNKDTLTYTITTAPANGQLWFDNVVTGTPINLNDTFTQSDIDTGRIIYAHDGTEPAGPDSFNFTIDDGTIVPIASAFTITINAVNDAPTSADNTVTTNEDTPYTVQLADFTYADEEEISSGDVFDQIRVTQLPTNGTLQLNGVNVALNGTVSVLDIASGNLIYTPNADLNGTPLDNFRFQVHNANNTDGNSYSASDYAMTINVAAVNDAPVLNSTIIDTGYKVQMNGTGGPGFVTVDEAILNYVDFTDVDGAKVNAVAITSVNDLGIGTWVYSTDGGSTWKPIDNGSLSPTKALLLDGTDPNTQLTFIPNNTRPGAPTISFKSWDKTTGAATNRVDTSGANSGGITAFSSNIATAIIHVDPRPPVITAPIVESPETGVIKEEEFTTSHVQVDRKVIEDTKTTNEKLVKEQPLFEEPVPLTDGIGPERPDGPLRDTVIIESQQDSDPDLDQIDIDLEALLQNIEDMGELPDAQTEQPLEPEESEGQPVNFTPQEEPLRKPSKEQTPPAGEQPLIEENLAPEEQPEPEVEGTEQEPGDEQAEEELQAAPTQTQNEAAPQAQTDNRAKETTAPAGSNFSDQVSKEASAFDAQRSEIMNVMNEVFDLLQCH